MDQEMAGIRMVKKLFRREAYNLWNPCSWQKPFRDKVFPLNQEQVFYCAYGRGALFYGITILGLKEADEVLIPDYICNTVMAPFYEAKIRIVYYKTQRNLTPDWEDVKFHLGDRTKAFLIVNYFGLPNDLDSARRFCDEHSLFLVEDNAHGFLSSLGSRPLGSWGDMSIFAFHKTVHLPAGAALVINKDIRFNKEKIFMGKSPSVARFILKSLFQQLQSLGEHSLDCDQLIRQIFPSAEDSVQEYDLKKYLLAMPAWSKYVLDRLQAQKVRQIRRDNYHYWLNYFQEKGELNAQALFSFLPEGVCPYVFPAYVRNREEFIKAMAIKGVEAFVWPYLPHDSGENDLSKHIVCLPLWQQNIRL